MKKEQIFCDRCRKEMNTAYRVGGADIIVQNSIGSQTLNVCQDCFKAIHAVLTKESK